MSVPGVFIKSIRGILLLWISVSLSFYCFLGMLDVTPPVFSIRSGHPEGFYMEPINQPMPFGNFWGPIFVSMGVGGVMLLVGLAVNRVTEQTDWNTGYPYRYWFVGTVFFVFVYGATFRLLISFPTGVDVTRSPPIQSAPMAVLLFIAAHSLLVGLLMSVYQREILRSQIASADTEALRVYMHNQWRLARLLIALAIAFMIGISIPITLTFTSEGVPIFGLLFLWGTFTIPLFGIALFLLFRVKACQDTLLGKYDQPSLTDRY
jgi:hypothetical protein